MNNMAMSYQEVPANLLLDEEVKTYDTIRATERLPLRFDESLFLDKIKSFSPNETAQLTDVIENEPQEEFDITQIEAGGQAVGVGDQNIDHNDDDGSRVSAINRNAVIESEIEGEGLQDVDGEQQETPTEEDRKDGFRLDQ